MDKQYLFNNYIEKFCDLDINDKREYIINSLLETLAITQKIAKDFDNATEILLNKELLDIKNIRTCSENDFYEGMFVYINSIQESFGIILKKVIEDYYD